MGWTGVAVGVRRTAGAPILAIETVECNDRRRRRSSDHRLPDRLRSGRRKRLSRRWLRHDRIGLRPFALGPLSFDRFVMRKRADIEDFAVRFRQMALDRRSDLHRLFAGRWIVGRRRRRVLLLLLDRSGAHRRTGLLVDERLFRLLMRARFRRGGADGHEQHQTKKEHIRNSFHQFHPLIEDEREIFTTKSFIASTSKPFWRRKLRNRQAMSSSSSISRTLPNSWNSCDHRGGRGPAARILRCRVTS